MKANHRRSFLQRRRQRGANLAILAAVGAMIIGFSGIGIYTGLQAYLQSEIQKAASTAAMAGAAVYYSDTAADGQPRPNAANAQAVAENTFDAIIANSGALRGFGVTRTSVTTNDSTDSVTVNARGVMGTPFLAPVGITEIEVTAAGTARALKYDVTAQLGGMGSINMVPDASLASRSRMVELAFPLVDGPGTDLFIQQSSPIEYVVEACNDTECYDLVPAARPAAGGRVGTSRTGSGDQVIAGSAYFDIAQANINKATRLRFTHGNVFLTEPGVAQTTVTPLIIDQVYIYGYAGACASPTQCGIPAGFDVVE